MTRILLVASAAALGLSSGALAQPSPSMSAPPPRATSQALPTPDFLAAAAQSDKFEVTEGKLAQTRGHNPKVREMGAMMVHDHTKSTAMLKGAAHRAGLPPMPPPMLGPDKQQMVSALRAAHGRDFDRTYVDQQIQAHTQALGLMQAYATGGPTGPVRDAAGQIVPVVQTHLHRFQSLQGSPG